MTRYGMCVKSRHMTTLLILSVLMTVLIPVPTEARPSGIISRRKRVSDQRLAELETLLGLSKIKGMIIKVPVGYGDVDPAKVGRKRRSPTDDSTNELRETRQIDERDSIFLPEEDNEILSQPLKDASDRLEYGGRY